MVHEGLHHLPLENLNLVFVENVGNLVCPASYDVGSHINVVLLSSPEGSDKVEKYPVMFRAVLIHVGFAMEKIDAKAALESLEFYKKIAKEMKDGTIDQSDGDMGLSNMKIE